MNIDDAPGNSGKALAVAGTPRHSRTGAACLRIRDQALRAGFFADFLLCPLGIGVLVTYGWMLGPAPERREFVAAFIAGALCWSLVEYLLHRFFLHGVPPLRRSHLMHHAAPQALIGAPAWLSPLLAMALFVLTDLLADATLASGVTSGVTLGYLAYVCIHYATHHLPNLRWTWLRRLRRAHALHHRSETACNFGVSTGLWDVVFRTAAPRPSTAAPMPPSPADRSYAPENERT